MTARHARESIRHPVEAHEAQATHTTLAVLNLDVPLADFFSILLRCSTVAS